MALDDIKDTIEIFGTKYNSQLFRELGCSFPNMIGQILRVDKKENGVVTLTRVDENHDWHCGCDHWNGPNLSVCAMCGRTPGESQ